MLSLKLGASDRRTSVGVIIGFSNMTKPIYVAVLSAAACLASADPKLPTIFGDNMVLQAGAKVPIWGTAEPYERIDIQFGDHHRTVYAAKDGHWMVELRNLSPGEPETLTVKGKTLTHEFKNVLVGEVWLASGQSNMEWQWNYFPANKKPAIGESEFPEIRFFQVTKKASSDPVLDVQGRWVVCNLESLKGFSLVGFHFARALHQTLKSPVGIIGSYWGGTPAEAWTRLSALDSMPETKSMADHYRAVSANYGEAQAEYERKLAEWNKTARFSDPGNKGFENGYANLNYNDITWPTLKLPQAWEGSGKRDLDIDGAVWFRKKIQIPAEWAGKELILEMGQIDDTDHTYFNGTLVGEIGPNIENSWQTPRVYRVPANQVKAGEALIAVRVLDSGGGGGVHQGPLRISPAVGSWEPIRLDVEWKYLIEASRPTPANSGNPPQQPYGPNSAIAPANLWNGMIHPIIPFAIKGVIWYQGESNANRAYQYRALFPGMIKDWRMGWGRGDFPFHFVQLANFMVRKDEAGESEWAELREAQTMTLRLKNTGMAVAIDIGEAGDIHPVNKIAVGERLARWALYKDYGKTDIVPSGPLYKSMEIQGDRIALTFDYTETGFATLSGQAIKGFSIAGEDRKFVWAQAKVVGNQIVVWAPSVKSPVAVRYGWADNPEVNLINKAGLPAVPFRTDSWPGLTIDRR